jgi:hypothetical protein
MPGHFLKQIREADPPMTTRAAVAAIRRWRIGRLRRRSLGGIYRGIAKLLEGYEATEEVLDAMDEALQSALSLVERTRVSMSFARDQESDRNS